MSFWVYVGVAFAVMWIWLIWEALNSPIMPDNYDIRHTRRNAREDAPPTDEKSPPSSQTYSGSTKPKHWKYATTDCPCQLDKTVTKHTKDCYINLKKTDQEYSQDNWNEGVKRLGPNPHSLLGDEYNE